MITAVTADVINNLTPDAGVVLFNVDISAIKTAAEMVALIETSSKTAENWLGVTDGGIKVDEGRKYWNPTYDSKRLPSIQEDYPDSAEPKISFTFLEQTAENIKAASGAADITTTGQKTTVHPRLELKKGDYLTNVVFVTMKGSEGLYVVELENALCTKGYNFASGDKKVGKSDVEFMGRVANPAVKTLPIHYHFLTNAA
jgi:hypothetical protein